MRTVILLASLAAFLAATWLYFWKDNVLHAVYWMALSISFELSARAIRD